MAPIQLLINNSPHEVEVAPDTPLLVGFARQAQHDGHQVRLRNGAVRRLHGASRWRGRALVPDCDFFGGVEEDHNHRRALGGQFASAAEGVDCRAGAAVRILPTGPDHVGGGAAGENSQAKRSAD